MGSGYYPPDKIVDMWYNEIKDCDWSTSCAKGYGGAVVGHFTPIVWKDMRVIACTYSDNTAGGSHVAACRFGSGPGSSNSCALPNMGGCYSS